MKKRGQVWVETVIYTLIALAIIGASLAFIKPKIEQLQDKSVIEQTSQILENINSIVSSVVQGAEGSRRVIEVSIKEGSLTFDGENDKIYFKMDSRYQYGELEREIREGSIIGNTKKRGDLFEVSLMLNYSRYNFTVGGVDKIETLSKSPGLQTISITNKGVLNPSDGKIVLDISLG